MRKKFFIFILFFLFFAFANKTFADTSCTINLLNTPYTSDSNLEFNVTGLSGNNDDQHRIILQKGSSAGGQRVGEWCATKKQLTNSSAILGNYVSGQYFLEVTNTCGVPVVGTVNIPMPENTICSQNITVNPGTQAQTSNADITVEQQPRPAYKNSPYIRLKFTSSKNNTFLTNQDYSFGLWIPGADPNNINAAVSTFFINSSSDKVLEVRISSTYLNSTKAVGTWNYKLWLGRGDNKLNNSSLITSGQFYVYPPANPNGTGIPSLAMNNNAFQANTNQDLYIKNVDPNQTYTVWFNNEAGVLFSQKFDSSRIDPNENKVTTTIDVGSPGKKTLCLTLATPGGGSGINTSLGLSCDYSIKDLDITALAPSGPPSPVQSNNPGIPNRLSIPVFSPTLPAPPPPCVTGKLVNGTCKEFDTAVGAIQTDPTEFIKRIFGIILSMSGGIAVLLIIYSAYKLILAQGNAEKIQGAKETLTSAIAGLLFIIFSLVILQIIGVDILHIPGFGK